MPALLRNILSPSILAATALLGLSLAGTASAGCGVPDARAFRPTAWLNGDHAGFIKTQYFPGQPFALNHWALSWVPRYQPRQPNTWSSVGGRVPWARM